MSVVDTIVFEEIFKVPDTQEHENMHVASTERNIYFPIGSDSMNKKSKTAISQNYLAIDNSNEIEINRAAELQLEFQC